MRQALYALADELRRLKTAGLKTVSVSDEAVAALRGAVHARSRQAAVSEGCAAPGSRPTSVDRGGIEPTPPPAARPPAPAPGREPVVQVLAVSGEAPVPALAPVPATPPTVVLPTGDKAARWSALRDLVLQDSVCCAHVRPGRKVVLGVGSLDAAIMFVGEAPGAEEEVQGEPFVGPAGQLLTKMIQGMGLRREDVYIGNIMNWRPELPGAGDGPQVGNRPPTEQEMRYCLPYLRAQIEIVNPGLIVALGATAAQGLLGFGSFKTLGEVRGRWREFAGKPLMVTYHPSYILRNQSNRSKRTIWEDLLKVMERAGLEISDRQRGYFLDQ